MMNDKKFTILIGVIFSAFIVTMVVFSNTAFAYELIEVKPENTMFQESLFFPNQLDDSYFTLEKFEQRGQSHWYAFNGRDGQQVLIQTMVPDLDHIRTFTPCFDLIIGEGKVTPDLEATDFHQDFSDTDWIITCEVEMTLQSSGLYYVRAHDDLNHYEVGDIGKFSLAFGGVTDFDLLQQLQVPYWMLLVNQFFENVVYVWIMLSLLFAVVVIVFVMLHRRGKND